MNRVLCFVFFVVVAVSGCSSVSHGVRHASVDTGWFVPVLSAPPVEPVALPQPRPAERAPLHRAEPTSLITRQPR